MPGDSALGGPRLDVNDPARVVLASWEDEPDTIAWRLHQIGDRAGAGAKP